MHFLARGTAIYSSFSGNQSEYLVQIQTANQPPFLARLLYRHPSQRPEIPDALIDSGSPVELPLVRAAGCDQSYETLSTVWLQMADRSVRASDGLRFVAGRVRPAVALGQTLPCYLLFPRYVQWKAHHKRAH